MKLSTFLPAVQLSTLAYASFLPQMPLQRAVKVPVVLGVMSQCPDAILCESVFDDVVEQVGGKIDLSLTFIGTINTSDSEFGVTCKHGPGECAGNVHELCASKYESFDKWWPFVQCQNKLPRLDIGTPAATLQCAAESDIAWDEGPAGACAGPDGSASGEEGVQLLKESVKVTASLGITKSCTIVINNKQVCIRDSDWYSCPGGHEPEDFVRQIETEFAKLNGGSSEWDA